MMDATNHSIFVSLTVQSDLIEKHNNPFIEGKIKDYLEDVFENNKILAQDIVISYTDYPKNKNIYISFVYRPNADTHEDTESYILKMFKSSHLPYSLNIVGITCHPTH